MPAIRVRSLEGWDVGMETVPVPIPGPGQLLVRSEAVGLCGSDVHASRGDAGYEWLRPPVTLGHEAVGTVVSAGPGVQAQPLLGRRIAVVAIRGCDDCKVCAEGLGNYCPERTCWGLHADGALAPWFVVDAARAWRVGGDSPVVGPELPGPTKTLEAPLAALLEPASIVLNALENLPADLSGTRMGITGPGAIGLLSGLECRRRGADVDVFGRLPGDERRLAFAAMLGLRCGNPAEVPVAPSRVGDLDPRYDAWVEASGAGAALAQAISWCRPQARIVVPALFGRLPEVDLNVLVRNGISVHGSYGYRREHFAAAEALITEYRSQLAEMVTTFPLAEGVQALRSTEASQVIKAVVLPQN